MSNHLEIIDKMIPGTLISRDLFSCLENSVQFVFPLHLKFPGNALKRAIAQSFMNLCVLHHQLIDYSAPDSFKSTTRSVFLGSNAEKSTSRSFAPFAAAKTKTERTERTSLSRQS